MNRVWIPGWQCSTSAFEPLWQILNETKPTVLEYADTTMDLDDWLDVQLDSIPENACLIGWSLGGMLAVELARRSRRVANVLVLNANVQFAGGPGLPEPVARQFMTRYERQPEATQRKFMALVSQSHSQAMSAHLLAGEHLHTLKWLYDIRLTANDNECPVHVLLSRDDQLVPVETAEAAWSDIARSVTVMEAEHDAPIQNAPEVAQWVAQYG